MSFSFSGVGSAKAIAAHAREKAAKTAAESHNARAKEVIEKAGEVVALAAGLLPTGATYAVAGHFDPSNGNLQISVKSEGGYIAEPVQAENYVRSRDTADGPVHETVPPA